MQLNFDAKKTCFANDAIVLSSYLLIVLLFYSITTLADQEDDNAQAVANDQANIRMLIESNVINFEKHSLFPNDLRSKAMETGGVSALQNPAAVIQSTDDGQSVVVIGYQRPDKRVIKKRTRPMPKGEAELILTQIAQPAIQARISADIRDANGMLSVIPDEWFYVNALSLELDADGNPTIESLKRRHPYLGNVLNTTPLIMSHEDAIEAREVMKQRQLNGVSDSEFKPKRAPLPIKTGSSEQRWWEK